MTTTLSNPHTLPYSRSVLLLDGYPTTPTPFGTLRPFAHPQAALAFARDWTGWSADHLAVIYHHGGGHQPPDLVRGGHIVAYQPGALANLLT